MKNLQTKLSYILYTLIAIICLMSFVPLDISLDGKILTDEDGNVYKLEWQDGWGATWAFKYPTEKIVNGDTLVIWKYYR